jgi:hypothetical protein
VQAGQAQLGDLTGAVEGTVERDREAKPSEKAVAKIAEEKAQAEEEAAKAESAEEAEDSGESSDEAAKAADES